MRERILYAEDEEETRSIVTEELRLEGYVVDAVPDGEDAIRAIESTTYDLLLLDIKMPRKSGLDVLQFLKERNLRPRVIMLTALDDLSMAIKAVRLGANDYLTKPYSLEQLLGAISRFLAR
jgi:DNA-binding response OmpR family regulator